PDLIEKVFLVERANERQIYGSYALAGKRASAPGKVRHRRRRWKSAYGYGISRIPRKIMLRRGSRFVWQGAFVPSTMGGRKAHPPKAEKMWKLKINKKEMEKALKSALAASASRDILISRYTIESKDTSKIPQLPILLDNKIEDVKKVKELKKVIKSLLNGIADKFFKERSIRAGKGKFRGRKYKKSAGLLLVTSKKVYAKGLGIDVVETSKLRVSDLAPGGKAGRLILFSENALEGLSKRFGK
ncbi:MAG: 50S ribosomal protein L4, partial [Nanoarchaeota archaeon]